MADARFMNGEPGWLESTLDLARALLTSSSDADAVIAYSLLRATMPEAELLSLANLREVVAMLPEPPFCPPIGLEVLRFSGYEPTGRSMRRLFETDHGLFGIEFSGVGQLCEGASAVTCTGRFALFSDSHSRLDEEMLDVFAQDDVVFAALGEAVSLLGLGTAERLYRTAQDFPTAHAAAAAGEAFGELF